MLRPLILVASLLLATPASALPAEVEQALPGAQRIGSANYQFLGIRLFRAELWTANDAFAWDRPFALTLTYERSARATTLVNRSISEMRQRGARNPEALRARLLACFADVARDDRITGVATSADTARFYLNGVRRCEISQPGFARDFFGIWLDAHGSQANLSARLRGDG